MRLKPVFALLMIFVGAIIFVIICKTLKKDIAKLAIAQKVRNLTTAAFLAVIANIFITYSQTPLMATISYGWYFAGIDWIVFFLLDFSVVYCYPKPNKKYKQLMFALFIIMSLDTLSFVINIFTGHEFVTQLTTWTNGEQFYHIDTTGPFAPNYPGFFYNIHLTLCYLTIALSFICMFYKMLSSPALYRIKYLSIIFVVLIVILLNVFYILLISPIDISVAFYALAGIVIYYGAMIYIPNLLERKTLHKVVHSMDSGLLILDTEGECTYANEYIKDIFGISDYRNKKIEEIVKNWTGTKNLKLISTIKPFEQKIQQIENSKIFYYKLRFNRIEDKGDHYLGCYFTLVDITEEQGFIEKERFRANHDKLTGIYNKERFYERAIEVLEQNPQEKYIMVCSDIGKFKLINDLYGTRIGDGILKKIANELLEKTIPGEVFGRIEADKFALLMPRNRFNKEIFDEAQKKVFSAVTSLALTPVCYIGVYEIDDTDMQVSVMCDRAFLAIETIKGNWTNRIAWYDVKLRERTLKDQALSSQLPDAIESNQIVMYLQPQWTKKGEILGGEALVRWLHPEEGIINPIDFIPALENNGMIPMLDQHIWELACKQLAKWKKGGHENLYISVNISPRDFFSLDVFTIFTNLVQQYDISPKNLNLEITEPVLEIDIEQNLSLFKKLQQCGFTIEMADFGSGNSSLKTLKNVDVNILKLDIKSLSESLNNERGYKILTNTIKMAQDLEMEIITEGVETEEQLNFLNKAGCKIFQGFYFSKPVDIETFERDCFRK